MTEEKKKFMHPDSEHLVRAYSILQQRAGVAFPVFDEQSYKLDTIAKTVHADYFGVVRFPSAEDKAIAYFCFIIKDHPMTDGNKRLAVLWLEIYAGAFKLEIDKKVMLDVLAVAVEQEKILPMYNMIPIVKSIVFPKKPNSPEKIIAF